MEPSGLSQHPPVTIEWRGKKIAVSSARLALSENKVAYDDRQEFLKLIYEANPRLVIDPDAPIIPKITTGDVYQYLKTLAARWTSGLPLVSKKEADRRTAICLDCPQKAKISGCYGCQGIANMLMNTPEESVFSTEGCLVCKCFLKTKVWLPAEVIMADERDLVFPENCWMHSLKE